VNLSTYLSADLQQDYSALSNLFSENEGMTIEHYFIAQKIERVKELLLYKIDFKRNCLSVTLQYGGAFE
jgi:hypothetical protein